MNKREALKEIRQLLSRANDETNALNRISTTEMMLNPGLTKTRLSIIVQNQTAAVWKLADALLTDGQEGV